MSIRFILKKKHSSASATADDSIIDEYVFDGSLFTIGSDAANTVVLAESASEQAVVVREGELLTLMSSAEGTSLNGQKLRREAIEPLACGDEIKIGNHIISVISDKTVSENNQNGTDFSPKINSPEQITPIVEFGNEENSPEQNSKFESPAETPVRNFADILNTLRTEEDSFYFIIENEGQEEKRILLEQPEIPLGFDSAHQFCCNHEQITALYAIVRKDWSGIIVESQRSGAVSVNDETIKTPHRLRNGDRLSFNALRKSNKKLPSLKLHEPSSLVALESILETRSRSENRNLTGTIGAGDLSAENALAVKQTVPILERRFFNHFSFFEVVSMAIGTLIAAVVIFLLLEFMVG